MAITSIGGVGTAITGGNTAATGTGAVPAGLATNDILLAVTVSGSNQAYETVEDDLSNAFALIDGEASGDLTFQAWWLRVGAEVPTGWAVDRGGGGGQMLCRLFGFRGCITTGTPFEDATLSAQVDTTTPATSEIDTTGANRWAVCVVGRDDDPAPSSGYPPDTWSDEGAASDTAGSDARVFGISLPVASASTVSSVTIGTWALSRFAQSLTLALIPAASGQSKTLTAATETGAAQALTVVKHRTLTAATSAEAAQSFDITKTIFKSLTAAEETGSASTLSFGRIFPITAAAETSSASAITKTLHVTLTPGSETDMARVLVIEGDPGEDPLEEDFFADHHFFYYYRG